MTATVIAERLTGAAPGTPVNITNEVNHAHRADDADPGLADGLDVPTAGVIRSYWVITRIKATGINNKIENVKWYTDGTNGMDDDHGGADAVKVMVGVSDTYKAPEDSELNGTNYPTLKDLGGGDKTRDAFTYKEAGGAELDLDALGMGDIDSDPGYSWYVIYQFEVNTSGLVGYLDPEEFKWKYDES